MIHSEQGTGNVRKSYRIDSFLPRLMMCDILSETRGSIIYSCSDPCAIVNHLQLLERSQSPLLCSGCGRCILESCNAGSSDEAVTGKVTSSSKHQTT